MVIKRHYSLFTAFDKAMKHDPDGSREDQWQYFLELMKSDEHYLEELARDYFDRWFAQFKVQRTETGVRLVGTSTVERRAEAAAERRAEREQMKAENLKKIRQAVVSQILTLDFVMPNEKKLRDCTGAEVARFGGVFTEIARHVKPTEVVGHHLNAKQIQNICSRFEPKRRGRPAMAAENRIGA